MIIKTNRQIQTRSAFTLIELLIVIAILLGLVGIVAVSLLNVSDRADVDMQRVQIEMIEDAIKQFRLDMKRVPSEDEQLEALWNKSILDEEEDEDRWRGPYLEEIVDKDKWGNEFIYYSPSQINENLPYDIISMGPDGEEDTEDDITNHNLNEDGDVEGMDDFDIDE